MIVRCALLLMLFPLAASAAAEELSPDLASRVETLLQKLSHDDFDEREAAMAELQRLGDPAWPLLRSHLNDPDPEVAKRIEQLGDVIGSIAPEQQAGVDALLVKLMDESPDTRSTAFDQLMVIKPGGLRLLQRHLSGEGSQPEFKVDPAPKVSTVGAAATASIALRNSGSSEFWIENRDWNPIQFSLSDPTTFAGEQLPSPPDSPPQVARRIHRFTSRIYFNPIRRWRAVKPADGLPDAKFSAVLVQPGVYTLTASCNLSSVGEIQPVWPGSNRPVTLSIGSKLRGGNTSKMTQRIDLFVLPDFDRHDPERKLALTITLPDDLNRVAGSKVQAVVALKSHDDTPITLERSLAHHAWYAWLDSTGTPVQWGSWESADAKADVTPPYELKPEAAIEWTLQLTAPKEPGDYSLAVGYQFPILPNKLPPFAGKYKLDVCARQSAIKIAPAQ